MKAHKDPSNCWKSLLKGDNVVDPLTFNEMEKKMVLERFQREVLGFYHFETYLGFCGNQ